MQLKKPARPPLDIKKAKDFLTGEVARILPLLDNFTVCNRHYERTFSFMQIPVLAIQITFWKPAPQPSSEEAKGKKIRFYTDAFAGVLPVFPLTSKDIETLTSLVVGLSGQLVVSVEECCKKTHTAVIFRLVPNPQHFELGK